MKEIFWILVVLVCLFSFLIWVDVDQDKACKRFGDQWQVSGTYDKYCTNRETGEIKGLAR